jgi:hypothetical protein
MADIGQVTVAVVPNAENFVNRMRGAILPQAGQFGAEFGRSFGDSALKAINDRLRLLGTGSGNQGRQSGRSFADAFAAEVQTRISAALKALPKARIGTELDDTDLAKIRLQLDRLGKANIGVDLSTTDALAKIKLIEASLKRLALESPDVRIRVNAGTALAEIVAMRAAINDFGQKTPGIFRQAFSGISNLIKQGFALLPDTLQNGIKGFGGFASSIGSSQVLIAALVVAISLIGPAVAAASFALVGLGASAGVAFLAFKGIQDQMKSGTVIGKQFSTQLDGLKGVLGTLERAAAANISGGLLDSLSQLRKYAPELTPIVSQLAAQLGKAFSIGTGGLISALQNMGPLFTAVGAGAVHLSQSFANFTASDKFKQFIVYASTEGPKVGSVLASLVGTFTSIARALQPIGDLFLTALKPFLEYTTKIFDVVGKVTSFLGSAGNGFGLFGGHAKAATPQVQGLAAATHDFDTELGNTAKSLGLTTTLAQTYATMAGITSDEVTKGAVSQSALTQAITKISFAYANATAAGSVYLAALQTFSSSAKTASDRATLIGATLRAANGDALGYAGAMSSAAVANQTLVTAFGATNSAGVTAIKQFVDLKTGAVDYMNAGAAPLIQALQGVQDANVAAAAATYQHELATKGGIKAGDDAYNQYIGQTRGALMDEATHFGLTADQAKRFVDTYLGGVNAPDIKKKIETIGGDATEDLLKRIATDLDALAHGITIPIATVFSGPTAGATPSANAAEHAIATALPSRGSKPARASGGGLPEGYSTINEQGWELLHKSGSNVQVFSHSQSKKMLPQGPSVPSFASGTNPFNGVDYSQPSSSGNSGAASVAAATQTASYDQSPTPTPPH